MNIYRNKRTRIPKTLDTKPLPPNTQDTRLKHSLIYKILRIETSECALELVTS